MDQIVKQMAKQKIINKENELEEVNNIFFFFGKHYLLSQDMAVLTTPSASEASDDVVSDYYDSKGNIMTLRRKRSIWSLGNIFKSGQRKQRSTKKKNFGADPAGRSYYYSTYRKHSFDPNHWRQTLAK